MVQQPAINANGRISAVLLLLPPLLLLLLL
jgi:hypothetical protein